MPKRDGKAAMYRNWSKAFRQGNAVYKLNMLGTAAVRALDDRFVALVGLDVRTVRVLRLIGDNPGIGFAEIATYGALERSLASRLIQSLVRGGHVERRNDPQDARRFGLYITETGGTARARADLLSEVGLELLFQNFDPAEVVAFTGMMDRLADWIDSDEFERSAAIRLDEAARRAETL